jgi:hypothetical protein
MGGDGRNGTGADLGRFAPRTKGPELGAESRKGCPRVKAYGVAGKEQLVNWAKNNIHHQGTKERKSPW